MPYLMHIGLDNPFRLGRNVHYFEFEGVRFKLIQNNPRKWADVLLTIVDTIGSPASERAYTVAGEFASALSWEFDVGTAIHDVVGGPGVPQKFRLRQARCSSFVFPRLPFPGMHSGYSLSRIARTTNDDQKKGLTLYREALGSNKVLLSLLMNWQIMEILGNSPVNWVNSAVRQHPQALLGVHSHLNALPLQGRSLGAYLVDDCRHAIAHIRRDAGRRALKFNDMEENERLWHSARVTRALARYYIRTELGVTEKLYLVRPHRGGFPRFLDNDTMRNAWYDSVR